MNNKKLIKSAKYLFCCSDLEKQISTLYMCVAKKIDSPDLSSLVVSTSYSSLKNSEAIKALLSNIPKPNLTPQQYPKEMAGLKAKVSEVLAQIDSSERLSYGDFVELFKALVQLEDNLAEVYLQIMQSNISQLIAAELGKSTYVRPSNVDKLFEDIMKDKEKQRELLIEVGYCITCQEYQTVDNTPTVRYRNPDGWILS